MTIEEVTKYQILLKSNLENDKRKLINLYNRANTLSKKIKMTYDLYSFSEIYDMAFPNSEPMCWECDRNLEKIYINEENRRINNFVNSINSKNDFYSKLSENIINIYRNINYPFYNNYNKFVENMPRLSKKEVLDIVYSFLDNYDERLYIYFKNKIEDLELLYSDYLDGYEGLTYNIESLNKSYMFLCLGYGNNLNTAGTIVHENGHAYEYSLQNMKNISWNSSDTEFYEVAPCFFEYAFFNYLKDNNIYPKDTKYCINAYFHEMFNSVYRMHLLTKMSDSEICENGYVHFEDYELSKYNEKIKEKLNYYELPELHDEINVIESYIYGIGRFFGIYLYDCYKRNPELFKTNFKNALCSYPINKDITSFESVGINKDELLKCNVLKKELKRHMN